MTHSFLAGDKGITTFFQLVEFFAVCFGEFAVQLGKPGDHAVGEKRQNDIVDPNQVGLP
ncbi:MAG: hypothetical protein IIC02_12895 [Planctomycetes bacterium]|nr:hypothetical protein [Planctomycetota bacterium]